MSTRHFNDREKIRNSISKDKVREKISYLQERVEEYRKLKEYNQIDIQLYKINILKELLEDN